MASSPEIIVQGGSTWIQARIGCLTASRVADAFAKLKNGDWAASRLDYQLELVAERLTGLATDHYISKEMLYGIENESAAVAAYEWERDVVAELAGYCPHPTIAYSGASPDRLIGSDGLLETKVPKTSTFVRVVLARKYGREIKMDTDDGYLMQVMWQMACTERAWCDLTYYDPRLPVGAAKPFIRRIERDDTLIKAMETEARIFLDEVAEMEAKLRE